MTDLPEKGADRPDPMAFGRRLAEGLGVNILVRDVETSIRWQAEVLQAEVIYWGICPKCLTDRPEAAGT